MYLRILKKRGDGVTTELAMISPWRANHLWVEKTPMGRVKGGETTPLRWSRPDLFRRSSMKLQVLAAEKSSRGNRRKRERETRQRVKKTKVIFHLPTERVTRAADNHKVWAGLMGLNKTVEICWVLFQHVHKAQLHHLYDGPRCTGPLQSVIPNRIWNIYKESLVWRLG